MSTALSATQLRDARCQPAQAGDRLTGITRNDFLCAAKIDALRLDAS